MSKFFEELTNRVLNGGEVTFGEASHLMEIDKQRDIMHLIGFANSIRDEFKGSLINICAITNAKSGRCSEDCRFCSQSSHYSTTIDKYPLLKKGELIARARRAAESGINRFSIVVSGRDVENSAEWESICGTINEMRSIEGLDICASLGTLTKESARDLKKAGLNRYHHNLETSETFFPSICTTHSYGIRAETVRTAKEAGMSVCCGGIFGLGETRTQRIELAFTLKELDVDSIPLNFLNPVPGTPLENAKPLHPMEILKIIALFRFINPKKGIRICGGRAKNLRSIQSLIFASGASGLMAGDYLTTAGSNLDDDKQMIKDLMLERI